MAVGSESLALQQALDAVPVAAFLISRDRTPLWANRAARRLAQTGGPILDSRLAHAVAACDAISTALATATEAAAPATLPTDVGLCERVVTASPFPGSEVLVASFVPPGGTLDAGDSAFRARLEAMLEHTTDIITVLDRDGTVRFSNAAAGRLTGLSGAVVNGRDALELVHPDDIDRAAAALAAALERPGPGPALELRVRFADDTWHDVEASINNLIGTAPIDGLVITLHDVTDRKRSEARLASLIANLTDVIVLLDERFEVTYISDSISRLIEAPPETNLGMSAFNDIHPDDLPRALDALGTVTSEPLGSMVRVEIRLESRPGTNRWRWVEATAVNRLADPAVRSLVVTLRDVTEQKLAAERLQRAYERERADADRLREIDQLKDEFLATVSHELRTPLAAIVGFADLLRHTDEPAAQAQLAARIAASSADMRAMIDNVLDFSALEAGRVSVRHERIRVAELVAATTESIACHLAPRAVDYDIDAGLEVAGDSRGLTHVLRNLLTNAAKYSPADAAIEVRAYPDGDRVVIEVADHGIGIDPELHDRVFDRFYRAPNASFTARGSGVGLNIVKRYTELMGGDVRLHSAPGQGSVFSIILPTR